MEAGLLNGNDLFAFYITSHPDEDDESELTFGYYDESRYVAGTMHWHDVALKYFWALKLDDILINGVAMNLCEGVSDCLCTPDSGTTDMAMPTWAYNKFIDATYEPYTSCETEMDFGEITFVIDGILYPLRSHKWNERVIKYDDELGGICRQRFSEQNILIPGNENLLILGDAFMTDYYSVFDRVTDRVGLAQVKHNVPEILIHYDEFDQYHDHVEY